MYPLEPLLEEALAMFNLPKTMYVVGGRTFVGRSRTLNLSSRLRSWSVDCRRSLSRFRGLGGGASRSRSSTKPVVDPSLDLAINCCSKHGRRDARRWRGSEVVIDPVDNLTVDSRSDLLALLLTMIISLGMETVMDMLVSSLVDIGIANLLDRFSIRGGISCDLLDLNWTTEVQGDLGRQDLSATSSKPQRRHRLTSSSRGARGPEYDFNWYWQEPVWLFMLVI